jgi:KDO2-lipid IV(A) lauroyltransferase
LGFIIYHLDRKHRWITISNLKTAFGKECPLASLKGISRRCFMHYGQVIMDIIKFPHLSEKEKSRIMVMEGQSHLREALQKGKGALLFSGHYGNWEIASYYLSKFAKLRVIARPLDNFLLEKELYELRTALGAEVISKYQATKQILYSLQNKEMVAILIDQNVLRSQAVFVDFFGKKAATTPSLAAFSLRTQAPLIPVFCYPTASRQYLLHIHRPLEISLSGDHDQDVLKITQICTKIIELQIRKNPDCWFWFHKRWKTRPARKGT